MKPVYQDIVGIDRERMEVIVRKANGKKYIVKPSKDMECHIKGRSVLLGDFAKVIKSPVSGEWVMIDFKIDPTMYKDTDCVLNNTCPEQDTLEEWL